jgi:hypothetical protein
MTKTVVLALAVGALAAALSIRASSGPASNVPLIPAAQSKSSATLGIFYRPSVQRANVWVGVLARVGGRALNPKRRGRTLVLGSNISGWAFSPDRSRLVVSVYPGARAILKFVDPTSLKLIATLSLGKGWAYPAAWLAPDRLLLLQYRADTFQLVVVDPIAGRVVRREGLPGSLSVSRPTQDGIALLLAPTTGIGPARLALLDSQGNMRTVELAQISAGSERPPDDPGSDEPIFRRRVPALAIDSDRRRAIVLGAGEPVAEVSLDTLAVSYHSLAQPVSFWSRLGGWLDPVAEAKAIDGPARYAQWLGNGLVAVTGSDAHSYKDSSGKLQMSYRAAGLRLLDTRDWSLRTLEAGADSFTRAGAELLATGSSWDSSSNERPGIGLVDYGPDGGQRFRLFKGEPVYMGLVYRGRAYVGVGEGSDMMQVVELGTGRIIGKRSGPLPWLLEGNSSLVSQF